MEKRKRNQLLTALLNDQACDLVYSREEAENILRKDIEKNIIDKMEGDIGAILDAIYIYENNISPEAFINQHTIYTENETNDYFMKSQIDEIELAASLIQEFQLSTIKWYFRQHLSETEKIEVGKEILYRRSLKYSNENKEKLLH